MSIINFLPNISKADLATITELAENSLLLNRISLRTKGYHVEGLNKKKAPPKENYSDNLSDNIDNGNNQGAEFEQHPELPFTGGKEPDQIILPESEVDAVPESKLSQAQKAQKEETRKRKREQDKQREELANRKKLKLAAAPKQALKERPKNRPGYTPPKFRPQ